MLVIDRKSDGTVRLYGRGRDVDEIDKALRFDREICRWCVLGENAEVSRSTERKRIITALKKHGDAMAPKTIAEAIDEPVNNVQKLLQRMAEVGEIVKVEYGRYALPPLHPLSE